MTRQDVGYYVLAALLFAASIPLYRIIIERGRGVDSQPAARPLAVVEPRMPKPRAQMNARLDQLPDSEGPVNRVECRNGFLFEVTPQGPLAVVRNGQLAQCEIHVATPEEARQVSSAGPSDQ